MSEFYVGYLPEPPSGIGRLLRWTVLCLLAGFGALAVTLAGSQSGFPASVFEFTQIREFEGVLEELPYPALLVLRPGITEPGHGLSRFLLVGEGKHGAGGEVSGLSGKRVKLNGKLIYRGNQTILELMKGSVVVLPDQAVAPQEITILGAATLTGEIVDTKCFLGVMNPGEGKVHRDCAARCLSGGIPPALLVRDAAGNSKLYVLAGLRGNPLPANWAAARAGKPITLTGMQVRSGDTLMLQIAGTAEP